MPSPWPARRRQLLLANGFACFASFLLAVALRGSFVALLALMSGLLVVHLAVAAVVGGRMVAARQQAQRQAFRRPQSLLSPALRPPRLLGDLGQPEYLTPRPAAASVVEALIEQAWADDGRDLASSPSAAAIPAVDPVGAEPPPAGTEDAMPLAPTAESLEAPAPAPVAEPDAIFTRPAGAGAAPRPRRAARPIYIHSHLDDPGVDPPKAVNQG